MSVYRCNRCGFVGEAALPPGTKISCAKCQTPATLFAAAFYIEKLVERYQIVRRELEALKQQEDGDDANASAEAPPVQPTPALLKDQIQSTLLLATEAQHQPLQSWLATRVAQVRFDFTQVDTTGFFDEAAAIIGGEYALLSSCLEQVRYAYRQDWSWTNIELGNKSAQEKTSLKAALRQLYSYTFFARYSYQKQKDAIGLALQTAPLIRRFFDGGWLEWWAFMQLLEFCIDRNVEFSGARGVQVEFQNEESRELDVFFLLGKLIPVVVECKSGEFRGELEKYRNLRKRLGLARSQFIICNPDLTDEQATGLTAMYDLTFVNLPAFSRHLHGLL